MPRFSSGLKLFLVAVVMGSAAFVSSSAQAQWRWTSDGDLWLLGRDITVEENVDGDLFVLGRRVQVSPDARVAGDAWLSGRSINVEGVIGGSLDLRAHKNVLGGMVEGNVSVRGESLTVSPGARVGGDIVRTRGTEVAVSPEATVGGEVRQDKGRESMTFWGSSGVDSEDSEMMVGMEMSGQMMAPILMMVMSDGPRRVICWLRSMMLVLLTLLSLAVAAGCPGFVHRMTEEVSRSPVRVVVYSALWLFVVPMVAMLMAMTVIGIPLALTLCLIWMAGLFAGMVATILVVGKMLMKRFFGSGDGSLMRHLLAAVLGLVVVIGLTFVPILEAVVWVVVLLAGPGVLLRRMELNWRSRRV